MKSSLTGSSSFNRVLGVMYGLHAAPLPGFIEVSRKGVLLTRVEKDLEKIKKMGFNVVYLWDIYRDPKLGATATPPWYPKDAPSKMKPLSFDPDMQSETETAFENVFKIALGKGLKVIPAICYNVPLQWLWSNLDAAKRTSEGLPHYTVYYHECFRSEKLRQYTQGRLEQLLERYVNNRYFNKSLARFRIEGNDAILDENGHPLFVIHNDTVDRGFCYCENCIRAWREEFLPKLYRHVDNFNVVHSTRYSSFNEIPLPKNKNNERLWSDFSIFFTESLTGWVEIIKSTIRKYIPDALFSIIMKYPRGGAVEYPNWEKVNELCEVLFMDPYPMEIGKVWNIKGYAYDFETYRSISLITEKPILLHFQFTTAHTFVPADIPHFSTRAPTKEEMLEQFYVAIGRGGKGMICWGFPPQIAESGQSQKTMKEEKAIGTAALLNEEAKKLFKISEGTKEVYGQIMLPYNYSSVIMGLPALFKLYKYLSMLGLIANPTFAGFMLDMKNRGHRYDALIGFDDSVRNIKKEHADSLVFWLKEGGAILCGAQSFVKDEKGEIITLKFFNREVIGSYPTNEAAAGDLRILEARSYLPLPGTYPKPTSSTALTATKGNVVAVQSRNNTDAIIVNDIGKGLVERVGIEGIPRLDDATTANLLEAFLKHLPEGSVRVSGPKMDEIDFSFRAGKELLIVFLVNNNRESRRINILVKPLNLGMKLSKEYIISEALTQKEIMRVKAEKGKDRMSFHVEIPPLGSKVFTVKPVF